MFLHSRGIRKKFLIILKPHEETESFNCFSCATKFFVPFFFMLSCTLWALNCYCCSNIGIVFNHLRIMKSLTYFRCCLLLISLLGIFAELFSHGRICSIVWINNNKKILISGIFSFNLAASIVIWLFFCTISFLLPLF